MDAYRYQQLAYLAVPVLLGIEFFRCANEERKDREETPLGYYVLDFFGFVFVALLPAAIIFTVWALETRAFPNQGVPLARLDRYAVMFFFMGAWWQVYLFTALRARRMAKTGAGGTGLWLPFLGLGVFSSLLVLWVSPWNLKWVSVAWFLAVFGVLAGLKVRMKYVERTMWVLAAFTFFAENLMFVWLESVI
ncbi:MAG: hypothetical protein OHK006_19090 [Thermodesulfovibrionales bacterium]